MSKRSLTGAPRRAPKTVRKVLADGTVKVYQYARDAAPKRKPRASADSVAALVDAFKRSPEWEDFSPATKATYSVYLRPLERLTQLAAKDLKRKLLLQMRDAIAVKRGRKGGRGAATGFMRTVKALMRWAVDREWLETNPAYGIKNLKGGTLRAWTEAELTTALDKLPEPYRRVVVLALYTGQRRGDLCALTWGAYDGRSIRLTQQKTGAALVIPCHSALKAELDAWREQVQVGRVLTPPRARAWTAPHLTREMKRELEKLGLRGINVHGLRKMAAQKLAEAGCTVHEIQAITGHKSLSMVQLYTDGAAQEVRAEAAILRLETAARDNRQKADN